MRLIGVLGAELERLDGNLHPTGLHMVRIQIHHCGDHVVKILRLFGVTDDLLVIGFMEAQAPITLQRRVLAANAVDPSDEFLEAVRSVSIPLLDLVLLGV